MQRTCVTLRVEPDDLDDFLDIYRAAATELAPSFDGLLAHSLFSDGTGYLAAYLESRDGSRAPRELASDPLALEWRARLAKLVSKHGAPTPLHPVFQLEQQLGFEVERASQRVCFRLQVDPARIDEYIQRHSPVWPEMLQAIHAAGNRNYTLFLDEDGSLVGYLETDDFEAAQASLARSEVSDRWESEMAGFFVGLEGGRPDENKRPMTEAFRWEAR